MIIKKLNLFLSQFFSFFILSALSFGVSAGVKEGGNFKVMLNGELIDQSELCSELSTYQNLLNKYQIKDSYGELESFINSTFQSLTLDFKIDRTKVCFTSFELGDILAVDSNENRVAAWLPYVGDNKENVLFIAKDNFEVLASRNSSAIVYGLMREQLHKYIENDLEYSVRDMKLARIYGKVISSFEKGTGRNELVSYAARLGFPYHKDARSFGGSYFPYGQVDEGGALEMSVRYMYQNKIKVSFDNSLKRDSLINAQKMELARGVKPRSFMFECDESMSNCKFADQKGGSGLRMIFNNNGALVLGASFIGASKDTLSFLKLPNSSQALNYRDNNFRNLNNGHKKFERSKPQAFHDGMDMGFASLVNRRDLSMDRAYSLKSEYGGRSKAWYEGFDEGVRLAASENKDEELYPNFDFSFYSQQVTCPVLNEFFGVLARKIESRVLSLTCEKGFLEANIEPSNEEGPSYFEYPEAGLGFNSRVVTAELSRLATIALPFLTTNKKPEVVMDTLRERAEYGDVYRLKIRTSSLFESYFW